MKVIRRFLMFAMLIGALVPFFFMKNKHGEPMLSIPGLNIAGGGGTGSSSIRPPGPANQTFYKWKDEHGQWHYGGKPPAGKSFKKVDVNTQANIIKSTPVPKETPQATLASSQAQKKPAYEPPKDRSDALTMDRALNIINDAKAVRGMMEDRNKQLENMNP